MSVLKIKDVQGQTWQSIPSIKGDKGDKGDAPVKGVDYWTQTDITEIVNEVLLAALPIGEGVSF